MDAKTAVDKMKRAGPMLVHRPGSNRNATFRGGHVMAGSILRICEACGKEFRGSITQILGGRCSRKCASRAPIEKHGESRTRLHIIWCSMKTRCFCKTVRAYPYYGGRGITVCDEWRDSFIAFRDWANANGYAADLEIDRIDNNGNYEPSNCRWANRVQQMQNTRKRRNAATSKFKGVSWQAQNKNWRVQLHANGKPIHGGCFATEIEAAKAYDQKAKEIYGEFAALNFP